MPLMTQNYMCIGDVSFPNFPITLAAQWSMQHYICLDKNPFDLVCLLQVL